MWPAGQQPSPAEPDAGTCRQWESWDGGRSLSDLRPDGLVRCSHWARLLTQPHRCLQMVDAGRCWPAPQPSAARSRLAADLYALGQWSAAWSHLARSPRSVGPVSSGLGCTWPTGSKCESAGGCSEEHCWLQPVVPGCASWLAEPCHSLVDRSTAVRRGRVLNSSTFGGPGFGKGTC